MKRISILLITAISFAAPACSNDPTQTGDDDVVGDDDQPMGDEWDKELDKRVVDYNAALRIAALRLTGDLPTMAEINQVANAGDDAAKQAAYETLLQQYMGRPAFARQMFYFWRDTFKMGGTAALDAAAAFAAMLSTNNGSYMDLFKASTGACPTFDAGTNAFTPADCMGPGPKAGVLTDAGVMAQFFGNFAFRRVKWIQEMFDCAKFPIELGGAPQEVGGPSPYTGDWPFLSIAGTANGGRVDFLEVKAVVCANCHSTANHQAVLFANYDLNGVYQPQIAVPTPLDGAPLAQRSDYLPSTEGPAWRFNVPTPDIPAFGAAMAADPDVAKCGVARIWNWAMGKTDIVDTLQEVPVVTIQGQLDAFTQSGFKMKDLIYAVYSSDDFVKF